VQDDEGDTKNIEDDADGDHVDDEFVVPQSPQTGWLAF
jgi:hypothetical protein